MLRATLNGHSCSLFHGETERWSVNLDFGASDKPFTEVLIWESAAVVVAGSGERVYALAITTGDVRKSFEVCDGFGHLAVATVDSKLAPPHETLFILGWHDIQAISTSLELIWHTRQVAIDGVTFHEVKAGVLRVDAEMDPPGGWVAVELDVATGHVLSRRPDYDDGRD